MPKITFENERIQILAPMHSNLREIAVANGVQLYTGIHKVFNCHGNGRCTSCRVEVSGSSLAPRNKVEEHALKNEPHLRLACQIEVLGELNVKTQGSLGKAGEKSA
jgi:ferredoxin